jgi:hypothetical protein
LNTQTYKYLNIQSNWGTNNKGGKGWPIFLLFLLVLQFEISKKKNKEVGEGGREGKLFYRNAFILFLLKMRCNYFPDLFPFLSLPFSPSYIIFVEHSLRNVRPAQENGHILGIWTKIYCAWKKKFTQFFFSPHAQ